MARHDEGFFAGGGGLRLFWEATTPEESRAVVAVVHGYADHSGRFRRTFAALADQGFTSHSFDYRGHGRAEGRRGHCDRWEEYLEDLERFLERVKEAAGGQKIFLLGHSHGGLMVARWLETRPQPGVDGGILSSPYLELALKAPAVKILGGKVASRIAPWASFKNEIHPEHVSHDPEVQKELLADTLYNQVISPRWFTEANRAQAEAFAQAGKIQVPLFVFCGSADPIASAPRTRSFFERVGSPDKRFREYPGMLHEPLNEVGREEVQRDIGGWISAHL
jgi:alpha-beta hydrolase superfamily lysophospholipase